MPTPRPAYAAFAAFGALWGVWGAALPAIRDHAGVTDGQLGLALLLVGVGALPAMALTGRAVDRTGGRVVAIVLVLLASAGVAVSTLATGPVSLAALLLLLGATSGAADVGANAVAGSAERATGRPVLTRAHGVFSAAVVMGSLGAGGVQAAGLPVAVAFGAVVVIAAAAAVPLWSIPPAADVTTSAGGAGRRWSVPLLPLVVAGAVGAVAFAVENAHQSWGAVFLADELGVATGLTAAAPAVFAGVASVTRFAVGGFSRVRTGRVLTGGALVAVTGTLVLARSDAVWVALLGLALAAAGTSVLFPTLLSAVLANVPDDARGRATSTVAATAYLGFVLGPVLVGAVSDAFGLRMAMVAVAGLAALAGLVLWPVTRWSAARMSAAADSENSTAGSR